MEHSLIQNPIKSTVTMFSVSNHALAEGSQIFEPIEKRYASDKKPDEQVKRAILEISIRIDHKIQLKFPAFQKKIARIF